MTPAERFEENLRLAYYHGRAWARRVPWIDAEDILQECLIGLWNAARAYDPSRGKFASLASACINYRVSRVIHVHKRRVQTVSLDAPVGEGAEDSEFTLQDTITRPQPLTNVEADLRKAAPLAARWHLDGYTQQEIGDSFGFSKAYANSLIGKEIRALRETLDRPMTPMLRRAKMVVQPGWDLRTEGESGPVTVRRVTNEEVAV